jgi:hypothetical protein
LKKKKSSAIEIKLKIVEDICCISIFYFLCPKNKYILIKNKKNKIKMLLAENAYGAHIRSRAQYI